MGQPDLIEMIRFLLSEVDRLHEMTEKGLSKEAFAECGIHGMLRGPRHVTMLCGKAAKKRLAEAAEARIESDPELSGRVYLGAYLDALESAIISRCIEKREPIARDLLKEIFASAKAAALATLETRRYFFPTFCIDEQGIDEFTIGPVRFERPRKFFERERAAWDKSMNAAAAEPCVEQKSGDREAFIKSTHEFFQRTEEEIKRFWWIASVEIAGAETDIGWERAHTVIDLSCTILRVLVSAKDSSYIGLANESPKQRTEFRFSLTQSGHFQPYQSVSAINMPVVPGFLKEAKNNVAGFAQLECAVDQVCKWNKLPPAEERLLTGLRWFGEAWKDRHPQSRLVKFATCLESLLMTGDKEGITEMLAERAALLLGTDYITRKQHYADAREVYSARSKAVHGDKKAKNNRFSTLNQKAHELAAWTLLTFAQMCPAFPKKCEFDKLLAEFFVAFKLGGNCAALDVLRKAAGPPPDAGKQAGS